MAKRSRRKRKGNVREVVVGTALLLLFVLMLSGFVWLWLRSGGVEVDSKNCPVDGPNSVTAVLIDTTDPISVTTLTDLRNELSKAVRETEPGGYLRIANVTATAGKVETKFDACNPGDASSVDQWTHNRHQQQDKWEKTFHRPLDELLNEIGQSSGSQQSPIMAAIQTTKLNLFDSDLAKHAKKILIVASDMIEHTDLYSQYKFGVEYRKFEDSAANLQYGTSLDGISVVILYVRRQNKKFSTDEHEQFWGKWVRLHHGDMDKLVPLEGLN
ncbi:MAG: hypothetical protein EOS76_11825 [Mesorhizobium sp.]|uniref:hypothetical protein n=1 Tax=unclassified Mesorhizobium TaxID=325217 RepID=UPI000F7644F1|nr:MULTISPECIES: hypothetical protein [unclassified Mesorhizobium]AZO35491.1 hypothetical protein EJ072_14205 [Mesorhizobium sp. M2A.F.Ca.ET.046.03.2.1]RVC81506.1 hypothetical protein EN766_03120 [Mesorhizobium sp. M2A.F.Ca.ET.046.02.1.1]RWB45844.1 MAG: hypothetical protein EOQ44_10675 [Mesorhizobium sp.]RWE19482.1 MAG: hypothetical protein EOS76_11825 [Mesorhizobium sp.]